MRAQGIALMLLAVVAATYHLSYVEAAGGGKPCLRDIECGIPAANVQSLREEASSITGSCVNGFCQCDAAYGCSGCTINGDTVQPPLSPPMSPDIDLCSNPFGGGKCKADSECFNGLCIKGKCICYSGWTCEYCTLDTISDIRNHAKCGDYTTGGAACTSNTDCDHGQCVAGDCQCQSGFVCDDCSVSQGDLTSGADQCSCPTNLCNGHGTCSNGQCTCDADYTGAYCNINLCEGISCSGHGSCSAGNCTCTAGYSGPNCDTGGGGCISDAECGVWAPIDGDSSQCTSYYPCVDGKYGGKCEAGSCVCNVGYTCAECTAKGFGECSQATGGAECSSAADCGPRDDGSNGGMCIEGRCVCFPGFNCPECNKVGSLWADERCPVFNPAHARGGGTCTSLQDCGPQSDGRTGGGCVDGKCECFTGFSCPYCNFVGDPDFDAGDNCTMPTGGGVCSSNADCVNGVCSSGHCVCYPGYDCPYCNAKAVVVGERIPGKCTVSAECGTAAAQGGECTNGECVCYPGFLCSMCDKHGLATCPPSDLVQPGTELVCPDPPPRTGGAQCDDVGDCGELPDGRYGGQCLDSGCSCWDGYTCPDCSKTKDEIAAGQSCNGAARIAVTALAVVVIVLSVVLGM